MATTTTSGALSQDPADQSGPNIKSRDYLAMEPYWRMVEAILGGAQKLRDEGEKYLPRYQNEKPTNDPDGQRYDPYEIRRQQAPLTNIYEDISLNLSSKPFSKELAMAEGTPEQYKQLAESIDGQGNNLHVFAQTVFSFGIDYAVTWILVDYTRAVKRADGQPLSVADEREQGMRPYWVHVPWYQLLAVYNDYIGGQEIITHARIYEPTVVLNGFVERTVQRVRVLNREPLTWDAAGKPASYAGATWTVYELVIQASTNEAAWVIVDSGDFTVGVIPLVKFQTGRRRGLSYLYDAPLRTLAYMQITEYQTESGLKNTTEMTCFPMLAGEGVTKPTDGTGDAISIGPRTVLYGSATVDGRPGTWKWIEPSAASIKEVREQLTKLQNDMRDLGMQPLTQANLTVITTGQVAVKANSRVQAWAIQFKDALEQAWQLTAQWMGQDYQPEVVIHTDFAAIMTDGSQMTTLQAMRAGGDLSRPNLLEAAMRYDYLPSDFDIAKNDQQLAEEQATLAPEQAIDPRTGLPLNVPPGGNVTPFPPRAGQG